MESELPNNVVPISKHPMFVRRVHNRRVVAQHVAKGQSPAKATQTEDLGKVIRAIGDGLTEIQREGSEQRGILANLVACVCDLKLMIDKLTKERNHG